MLPLTGNEPSTSGLSVVLTSCIYSLMPSHLGDLGTTHTTYTPKYINQFLMALHATFTTGMCSFDPNIGFRIGQDI